MIPKVIITGKHTEESIRKFRELPDCQVVFVERLEEIRPEDCADAQMLVGGASPEIVKKMPNLRFVQLFSAGANGFRWLPEQVVLANAYGAYGDSIAEHMLTTTLMAMKRMPEISGNAEAEGLGTAQRH